MLLSGVQIRIRLDSRLKHAGMTDFGWAIYLTQQAAGNEPLVFKRLLNVILSVAKNLDLSFLGGLLHAI